MNKHDKIKQEVDEFNERLEKAYDTFYGDVYIKLFIPNRVQTDLKYTNLQKTHNIITLKPKYKNSKIKLKMHINVSTQPNNKTKKKSIH